MPPGEHLGDEIGPYRLLSILGEGGFGIVYLAERRSPYVQRVALKVIKPGMDSRAVIARFEQERQALALLDHPHIARILDAGATPQGRPYFAMEHVPGEPITAYASRHGLSVTERVELFAPVCDAVHQAHSHGLVHRDLTPSNILVARVDGKGFARIIDFGITRALSHTLSDKTLLTGQGVAIGTPEYMSPEQAEGEEVGPASDIFSLGVLLHEVLTGSLPYDAADLRRRPAAEIRRIVARSAIVPARRAAHGISADLETVLLRAMAREPSRRYRTAADMADDLRRVLADEPIMARRDSAIYVARVKLRSLAARQPLAVLALTWVLTAVLVQQLLVPALFTWTHAAGAFERGLATLVRPVPGQWQHVRAITLDDAVTPAELGTLAGVDGVGSTGSSLRAVHGALMKRLAQADPAAVAWDINFAGPSDFDAAFVEGLAALRDRPRPIPWVTAVRPWPLDESGALSLSPRIVEAPGARWGGISAGQGQAFVYVHLFAQRPPGRAVPSLPLAAYAATAHPGWDAELAVEPDQDVVEVIFSRPRADAPRLRERLPKDQAARVVTSIQPHNATDARFGLEPSDRIGLFEVHVPPDAALAHTAKSYQEVLRLTPEALREFLNGSIVVIGDARAAPNDIVPLHDGRRVPGTYVVASAVEQLSQGWAVSRPSDSTASMSTAFAAALGTILGAALSLKHWRRWCALLLGLVAMAGASVALYAAARLYANPLIPMVAWVVACELAALIRSPSAARATVLKGG